MLSSYSYRDDTTSRWVAVLLALVMVLFLIPVTAVRADPGDFVYQINVGGGDFGDYTGIDANGTTGGVTVAGMELGVAGGGPFSDGGIIGTVPADVFLSVGRSAVGAGAEMNWTFDVDANETYEVRLHLGESDVVAATEDRLFNVEIEGAEVLSNYNILDAAGGADIAYTLSFETTVSGDGDLNIDFISIDQGGPVRGIDILEAQDAPVAVDDAASTDEDVAVVVDVLANDSDADGDSLSVSAVTQGANGAVANNGTDVTYTPAADFNGADSFTYTVSDGNGGTDTATVNVTVDPVNDAPVAADDVVSTDEDTAVVVDVLANDTDVDGDSLAVSAVTQGADGAVGNNGSDVTYTPAAGFTGADSFTYTVSDGNGGTDTATVNVTVDSDAGLPPGGTFIDDDGNTHEGQIEAIAAEGITLGCNPPVNNLYCPGDDVTRGQMAAFLVRAFDLTDDGGMDWFTDDNGTTFEADINKLATAGVTVGCNPPANTEYCPTDDVTRGQMAAFLVRAFDLTDDGGMDWFTDDDGSTFEDDINKLATAGITLGCNPPANTLYCPDDSVKRDQMASFLARALDLDPIFPPPRN